MVNEDLYINIEMGNEEQFKTDLLINNMIFN